MDGNTAPTARSIRLMYSGSAILRQESHYTEFWYDILQPYQNYIPLSYDGSDVVQKVNWARQHDAIAQQIADNATKIAQLYLKDDAVACYWHRLLVRYSKRLAFNVTLTSAFHRVQFVANVSAEVEKLAKTESGFCDFAKDWLMPPHMA
jgi:hypothetical protein